MTKDETQRAIEYRDVLQGYIDGKTIQYLNIIGAMADQWQDFKDGEAPSWNFCKIMYRIKPEPREFWINPAVMEVIDIDPGDSPVKWVRVREVLDE